MGLKGLFGSQGDSDIESEREALRRQRYEAAAELEHLKRTLSERVAHVQMRERELDQALERVGKQEAGGGARLAAVRARLAEAREVRAARNDEEQRELLRDTRASRRHKGD